MDHVRHMGLFNVPSYFTVGLVGAGGIGALTALNLAKMGVRQLTVWDADTVSPENIATQLHPVSGVGKLKTEVLVETLETFSDEILVEPVAQRLGPGMDLPYPFDLFISAVDSITARQDIWSVVTSSRVDWYLDLRMSALEYQHFLVAMHDPGAVERYHTMLMSIKEDDVPEEVCTEKATFFTASAAAAHAGKVLYDILLDKATSHRLIHYIADEQIASFRI